MVKISVHLRTLLHMEKQIHSDHRHKKRHQTERDRYRKTLVMLILLEELLHTVTFELYRFVFNPFKVTMCVLNSVICVYVSLHVCVFVCLCVCQLIPGRCKFLQGSSVVLVAEDDRWSSIVDDIDVISVTFLHRHFIHNHNRSNGHFSQSCKRRLSDNCIYYAI